MLRYQFGTALHDGNFCEDESLFRPDTLEVELMAFLLPVTWLDCQHLSPQQQAAVILYAVVSWWNRLDKSV